jgi:hypothetical protein
MVSGEACCETAPGMLVFSCAQSWARLRRFSSAYASRTSFTRKGPPCTALARVPPSFQTQTPLARAITRAQLRPRLQCGGHFLLTAVFLFVQFQVSLWAFSARVGLRFVQGTERMAAGMMDCSRLCAGMDPAHADRAVRVRCRECESEAVRLGCRGRERHPVRFSRRSG